MDRTGKLVALRQVDILTPWQEEVVDGEIYRWPLVTGAYALAQWSDITAQPAANLPTQPNLLIIRTAAEDTILSQISADSRFWVIDRAERPNAAQFLALRDWLVAQEWSLTQVLEAVGTAPGGRTLGVIADTLRIRLQALPKRTG